MPHSGKPASHPVRPEIREAQEIYSRYAVLNKSHTENSKSSAQVARSVGQAVVRPGAGGLKPRDSKPFRITVRFSEDERESLVGRAEKACQTLSEYIRTSVLGLAYGSSIDPEQYRLLTQINRELSRQGNNLNQIAKHLNGHTATPAQGESCLVMLTRSLLETHKIVRRALADGQTGK